MKTIINQLKQLIILNILFLILSNYLSGEEIKGRVLGLDQNGEKIHLPFATIQVLGTSKGIISDKDGYFSLDLIPGNKIIVSYAGYKKDTISITSQSKFLEIILQQEYTTDEVLVEKSKPDLILKESRIEKTEVITNSGLKKAACCNLSESFITNPTVDVTYEDAITGVKQIQLLGLAQNYTQLMLEMVPNLQGLASNYSLLFVPGPWINSISISKGTSSVTRGYESITGQINVELKGPDNSDRFFVNYYLNDILRMETNIITSHNIGGEIYLTNFIHGNYFNKIVDHNSDGFLDLPMNQQINLLQRLDYRGEKFEGKTFLHWLWNNSKSGQVDFFRKPSSDLFWGSNIDIKRFNFFTKNGYFLRENQNIGSIVSFVHHKQNSSFGKRNFNIEQNSLFMSILWSSSLSGEEDEHSEDVVKSSFQMIDYTLGGNYTFNNYLQKLDSLDFSVKESVLGVFSEFNLHLGENLQILAGLRYDFHNISGSLFTPRLHIKYRINEINTLRVSFGRGYHFPLPIIENQNILTSSRRIVFLEELKMEEAWNFGINSTHNFVLFGKNFILNLEYFHTRFVNQTIIDRDISPNNVFIYNLKGKSYSNSFQIDLTANLSDNFAILTALRYNDVWITTNSKLQIKPLVSPLKGLFNFAYKPEPFALDFTVEVNGGGRLPETSSNPIEYQVGSKFKPFVVFYGQISYNIGNLEIYLGSENIFNFRQVNPIIAAREPFSNYFDGSMIWGPIEGRKTYVGIRYCF